MLRSRGGLKWNGSIFISTKCELVSYDFALIFLNLEISASDTGVQTDILDAPLTLYDRNYTCTDEPDGSKNCTEHPLPGIKITEGYPVPIGEYKFQKNSPSTFV